MRRYICVAEAAQSVGVCYGSPWRLLELSHFKSSQYRGKERHARANHKTRWLRSSSLMPHSPSRTAKQFVCTPLGSLPSGPPPWTEFQLLGLKHFSLLELKIFFSQVPWSYKPSSSKNPPTPYFSGQQIMTSYLWRQSINKKWKLIRGY